MWQVSDGAKVAGWNGGFTTGLGAAKWFATSRDASKAVTVESDDRFGVLDLKSGAKLWTARATDHFLMCFAFSPDGRVVASGAGYVDTVIRLWDSQSGRPLGTLEGHRGFVTKLHFLDDGKRLVSSSADQTVRIWDLESRRVLQTLRGHETEVHALAVLPGERQIVSGDKAGRIKILNVETEGRRLTAGVLPPVQRMAWQLEPDGNSMVALDRDGRRLTRREGRSFAQESTLLELDTRESLPRGFSAVIAPSSPRIAIAYRSKLQVWDWERRALVREWSQPEGARIVDPKKFSPDGESLFVHVFRFEEGISLEEWALASEGSPRTVLALGRSSPRQVPPQVSFDHHDIIADNSSGRVTRVDLASGRSRVLDLTIPSPSYGPAISPNGNSLFLPSQRGFGMLLDAATDRPLATLTGFMFGVHCGTFSPDSQRLVVGSTGTEAVTFWDLNSRERLLTLPSEASLMLAMAFSPDGNLLVGQSITGAQDGSLYYWRVPSWEDIARAEAAEAVAPKPPAP